MGDPSNPTGTGFVRLQSKYATGTTTVGNHPRTFDKNLAFFGGPDGTDLTDAQIEAMPQFGKWKFEYYKATAANSPVIATQYYKTTARALTIDGFKQSVKLPELTASLSSKLTNESVCATATYCYYKQVSGPFVATWSSSKEAGLVPATVMARIYGLKDITATPIVGFEDRITFRSSRTTASILCGEGETSVQSYCSGSSPSAASFSTNATIDGLDLVSRSPDGTDVSHFHSLRQLQ
jgi:hypothetical protein